MSYDLFLRPRKVAIGKKDFEAYFQDRRFYDAEAGHAAYSNEETKAYFSFEWVDARDDEEGELYPIAFNINYFRPSYFIMEAEIEVSALVRAFDLVVDDPQWKGMGSVPGSRALKQPRLLCPANMRLCPASAAH